MQKSALLRHLTWVGLAVACLVVVILLPRLAYEPAGTPPSFPLASLTLKRADGKTIPLSIEVATTREQQAYGLMFRRSLPDDRGMIFIWPSDQPLIMWMKNTFIPLDMLFVEHDGNISKIIRNAVPQDLTPLPSGTPARAVIEINGGAAERFGLEIGDKVIYPGLSGAP